MKIRATIVLMAVLCTACTSYAATARLATETFVTNKIAAAVAAIPAPDYAAVSNAAMSALQPSATNALDIALRGEIAGLAKIAEYYPDGSVKSAAELTSGIKYDFATNGTERTASVKPFCDTGTAENDNSDLVGRVVIPPFVDVDGNPYLTDDGTRYRVVGVSGGEPYDNNLNLTAIVAPNTVTTIGVRAFVLCCLLTSVSLPAATTIGGYAFSECYALTSVSLPAATTIGEGALNLCWALASVSLPAATTIEDDAFGECYLLTSVSLPAATTIGGRVFYYCEALAVVDFGATLSSVSVLGNGVFTAVPTTCKIVVPDAQYDDWTTAIGWSALVTAGYKFLRHSEWEYARRYEIPDTTGMLKYSDMEGTGRVTISTNEQGKVIIDGEGYGNATTNVAGLMSAADKTKMDCYIALRSDIPDDADIAFVVSNAVPAWAMATTKPTYYAADVGALPNDATLAGIANFSNAVLQVGLNIDTNTVAAINALVEDGDELPVGGAATVGGLLLALAAAVAALKRGKADATELRYDIGTETAITSASQEVVEGVTVNYGAATLADRTANRVAITAAIDELRLTFPAAESGKVRDFELRVEVGTGFAALTAPALVPIAATGETVTLENPDGEIPALADGAADAKGVTLLYFSETAPGVFLVKGEEVKEA